MNNDGPKYQQYIGLYLIHLACNKFYEVVRKRNGTLEVENAILTNSNKNNIYYV